MMPEASYNEPSTSRSALVLYPANEAYTVTALERAFKTVLPGWEVDTARRPDKPAKEYDLQYCDYDELDWDAAEQPGRLCNSYMLRKALIRKNYLATSVSHRLSKHPDSLLATTIPKTYPFQIAHADELDELIYDELYDLEQDFQQQANDEESSTSHKWWILKPAMADKGQGIRLFDSRESLQAILEGFEDDSDDEEREDEGVSSTRVSLSTMRDWVIQEYVNNPLILDARGSTDPADGIRTGRKFHLRVYTLAVGALQVYISTEMLALFAEKPYAPPKASPAGDDEENDEAWEQDLSSHLTNTCLQSDEDSQENSVYLLSDLVGKEYLSSTTGEVLGALGQQQVDSVIVRIGEVVAETFRAGLAFRAGLGMSTHFTVSPDAFEVFGIDILLSTPDSEGAEVPVHLLEVNACPDFRQSGSRLHGVIERLFEGVLRTAVEPYFKPGHAGSWSIGERRDKWLKCADEVVAKPPGIV